MSLNRKKSYMMVMLARILVCSDNISLLQKFALFLSADYVNPRNFKEQPVFPFVCHCLYKSLLFAVCGLLFVGIVYTINLNVLQLILTLANMK